MKQKWNRKETETDLKQSWNRSEKDMKRWKKHADWLAAVCLSFKPVSDLFQDCFRTVSDLFQICFRTVSVFQICFRTVSDLFLFSFCFLSVSFQLYARLNPRMTKLFCNVVDQGGVKSTPLLTGERMHIFSCGFLHRVARYKIYSETWYSCRWCLSTGN